MEKLESREASSLFDEIKALYSHMPRHRLYQLASLFILQLISAASEVASLGAIIPFLGALVNADELITNPSYQPWLEMFGIVEPTQLVTCLAILFALVASMANALRLLTLWTQARLAAAIGNDLCTEVYRRILYQPYEYHTNINSSTLISNITNDFRGSMTAIRNVMMIATQGLVILFIAIALLAYNTKVTVLIFFIILVSYLIISQVTRARLIRISRMRSDLFMLRLKSMQEGLGGIRDVLLFGHQVSFTKLFANADKRLRRLAATTTVINSAPRYLMEALGIIIICTLAAILTNASNGKSVLPLLGTMALAANRLLPAVQQCYASFAGILSVRISLERTLNKLSLQIDPINVINRTKELLCNQSIMLEDVWFHYGVADKEIQSKDWTLQDINIDIKANTTVALVGYTGSGKSTVSDIIMGLLRPDKGRVLIDGICITEDNMIAWRENITHVPQAIYLSDANIAENIAFGIPKKEIDMDRVREAAKMAQLADFIESRPLGYDEIIGERGIRLSGGQRQRVGIARALYKKSQVLVFDEATSGLDGVTEAKVMKAIDDLNHRMTIILIAHRLTTVRNVDEIFEIQDGKVINRGTFNGLKNKSETFMAMANSSTTKLNETI